MIKKISNNDILLIDAGPEYWGYSSDITRSYPVNGRFSENQKTIYEIVLKTQLEVLKNLKPGVTWAQMLEVSHKELLRQLLYQNFVIGDIEEMFKERIHSLFMPHGLGHYVGLEVHDPPKIPEGLLQLNNVLTVEPGCYFMSILFENATPQQKKIFEHGKN